MPKSQSSSDQCPDIVLNPSIISAEIRLTCKRGDGNTIADTDNAFVGKS